MELVDGSTLADRIVQGAIPVDEALAIARQIAEALEAAHERGIVHRDLKPANIKLRPDGTVKVLDFGLAKAVGPAARVPDVSQRATHTAPARTARGVIVGTAAYMSPEQAAGKTVDHRTDIWAFGCVLFEMLTGRAAFGGDSLTDTLAAVMRAEADWSRVPSAVTDPLRELMRRCLRKDPRQRLQAIGDARIALEDVLARHAVSAAPGESEAARTRTSRRWSLPWGWAALLLVAVAAISSLMAYRVGTRRGVPAAPAVRRTNIDLPPGVNLSVQRSGPTFASSPDDSKLVIVGQRDNGQTQLYLRFLDQEETRPIPGTAGAQAPFFAPDGKWIGFWADGRLQKWPVAGGQPTTICNCDAATGAAWLPDDVIVFAAKSGLQRVFVQEGRPTVIAMRDTSEGSYGSPVALPGGNAVMFSISDGVLERRVDVLTLNDGKRTPLVYGAEQPRFIAPGFVVVNRSGTLEVAPFDTARLKVGAFARLGEGTPTAGAQSMAGGGVVVSYDVAAAGRTMVFVKAPPRDQRGVYKLTLRGEVELLSSEPRAYGDPAVSPDGNKIAVDVWIKERSNEIRVLDLVLGGWSTITSGEPDWQPRWQDDHTLIYTRGQGKNRNEFWHEYTQQATSNATPTLLASFPHPISSHAVAPQHDAVVFSKVGQTGTDLWYQPLGRDGTTRQAQPLIVTPADEYAISCGFSPDGRRLAYWARADGHSQIYVTDLPAGSTMSLVSSAGVAPCWSKDGRQIFYWNGNTVMAVTVRAGEPFSAEAPRKLFDSPVTLVEGWDVARDAFYVVGYEASRTSPIVFVSDITADLPSRAKAR
jgi:serine/threonine-protein kinase